MPLNISSKTNANNPTSQPAARPSVQINPMKPSTARALALKERLASGGQGTAQPPAPRPAATAGRAASNAQMKRYQTPQAPQAPVAPPPPTSQPLANIPPPPSGANPQAAPPAAPSAPEAPAGAQPHMVAGAEKPAEATNDFSSRQFALLAQQEKRLRKAQQEFKAQQEAWKQEQAAYIKKDQLSGPEALKTLAELGLPYERLLELQIAQANPDPNQPILDKIAQLEARNAELVSRLEKVDQTFVERDNLQKQQAIAQFKKDAQLLVDSDPAYETIRATESVDEVVDLITRVFDEDGELLSVEEACRLVEDKLSELEYQRYERLSQLSKIKARLAPKPQESPAQVEEEVAATPEPQPPAQQPNTTRTLTQAGTVSRPLTARERAINAVLEAQQKRK